MNLENSENPVIPECPVGTQPNVFTMTLSIDLGYNVNLLNIAKYLTIDDTILGIKYKFGERTFVKGLYIRKSQKSFYNQVSLIVKGRTKDLNVKIFQNGKLQLTGCKERGDAVYVKKILLQYFMSISGTEKIELRKVLAPGAPPVKVPTGLPTPPVKVPTEYLAPRAPTGMYVDQDILVDNDNFLYGYNRGGWKCIGYVTQTGDYIVDNKIVSKIAGFFITQKKYLNSYLVYDNRGVLIGKKKLRLKYYKKLFNKFKLDEVVDGDKILLMHGDNIIGEIIYEWNMPPETPVETPETPVETPETSVETPVETPETSVETPVETPETPVETPETPVETPETTPVETPETFDEDYSKEILESKNSTFGDDTVDIYSLMFSFNVGFKMNRGKLFESLLKNEYITKYEPERYSGVYWMLKLNKRGDFWCNCKNKCICENISCIFFGSGSVICSGIKNEDTITSVYQYITQFCNKNKSELVVNLSNLIF
jgi:TATA-box binding protein (TBP) (component of TFIID and TFIIIB)